jgi:hypothetical protein
MGVPQGIAHSRSQCHDLRCRRWQVQLAGRRNTHMYVFILLFFCGFSTATNMVTMDRFLH